MDEVEGCFVVFLVVVFLALGAVLGFAITRNHYQDGAVDRGYAEWVVDDNPRKGTYWEWIEPTRATE